MAIQLVKPIGASGRSQGWPQSLMLMLLVVHAVAFNQMGIVSLYLKDKTEDKIVQDPP
jgi:hypothetical protein